MPSETPRNATKTHLYAVFYPPPQRIFTFLAKTAQNANKYTYRKQENEAHHATTHHHNTPHPSESTAKQRQKTAKRSTRKSTRKKHNNKQGEMFKMSYSSCVCVCACSFLQSSRPTSQIYLNISNFYHRPAVSVPCSRVRALCALCGGVCWYVVLCFCVVGDLC